MVEFSPFKRDVVSSSLTRPMEMKMCDKDVAKIIRDEVFDEIIAIIEQLPVYRMCVKDIINYLEQVKTKGSS